MLPKKLDEGVQDISQYNFRLVAELLMAGLVAGCIFVLEILVQFDPTVITDWKEWLDNIGGGLVRAVAGGALAFWAIKRTTG